MNNTIVTALINETGKQMTGEAIGTPITVLDPELLEALDYRIVMNGQRVKPTEVLNSEKYEYPCLIGRMDQLINRNILLDDIVYLDKSMIDIRTGCARAEIEIIPLMATALTKAGWEDRVIRNFLVPEDVPLKDGIESITNVLREVEMVPWLNTGGLEKLAEQANESYVRLTGNIAKQLFDPERLLRGHSVLMYSNKYAHVIVKLMPADRSEIQLLSGVWYPTTDESEAQCKADLPGSRVSKAETKKLYWKHHRDGVKPNEVDESIVLDIE